MKKFNSGSTSLLMSLAEIVIGVLLLIDPAKFTAGIIVTLGIVMLIMGCWQLLAYFLTDAEEAAKEGRLTKGILFALLGLFCAFKSGWFIAAFPMITALYGVLILIAGVGKLQKAVDMIRVKQSYWYVTFISAVLTLSVAFLIICNPFTSVTVLWTFIGVTLIVEAVADVLAFIFANKSWLAEIRRDQSET